VTADARSGLDHVVSAASGLTVRRRRRPGADGLSVTAEAALLGLVAKVSPLPVPRVLGLWPEREEMEMERVPGVPLLELLPRARASELERLGGELGRFLAAVNAIPVSEVAGTVPVDDTSMTAYLEEAAEMVDVVVDEVPLPHQRAVLRFLAAAPPAEPDELRLSHHDLGAEHVFVMPESLAITGIIDWSDAAVTDPALDLGLVLRDLGQGAFRCALKEHDPAHEERALFYARVRALEDLAYGIAEGEETYRRNALRAIEAVIRNVA
jgi:aminoglycoside phosphotransferase (APT) family kinase protein